jgi:hypothetical protein
VKLLGWKAVAFYYLFKASYEAIVMEDPKTWRVWGLQNDLRFNGKLFQLSDASEQNLSP